MLSTCSVKNELASRYSLALLELALEREQLSVVEKDLHSLAKMCSDSKDFLFMLNCPTISAKEKCIALAAISEKAHFSKTIADFIKLVAGNNRAFALPAMIEAFFVLLAKKNGVINVTVISATELEKRQVEKLTATLTKAFGRNIDLALKIDTKLLGGLMIKIGSTLIDSSLRSQLQRLKTMMKGA